MLPVVAETLEADDEDRRQGPEVELLGRLLVLLALWTVPEIYIVGCPGVCAASGSWGVIPGSHEEVKGCKPLCPLFGDVPMFIRSKIKHSCFLNHFYFIVHFIDTSLLALLSGK